MTGNYEGRLQNSGFLTNSNITDNKNEISINNKGRKGKKTTILKR